MCFRVLAFEEVEKRGKLQRESIINTNLIINNNNINNNFSQSATLSKSPFDTYPGINSFLIF